MDSSKCFTFNETIDNETGSIRIHSQRYYKSINNIERVCKLIYNYNLEFKKVPRQTVPITQPLQGVKDPLKFVMIHCAEELKLGNKR